MGDRSAKGDNAKYRSAEAAVGAFDGLAFAHEVVAWYSASGREELDQAMEVAQRDRVRLARSLEVSAKTLSEAVTF